MNLMTPKVTLFFSLTFIFVQNFEFTLLFLGWFTASGSNICYVTYAFDNSPTTIMNLISHMKKIVETKRFEFVAKEARDLVLKIKLDDMEKVTVVGFSFGAHIASKTCRYLFQKTNQKVGKLIGIL